MSDTGAGGSQSDDASGGNAGDSPESSASSGLSHQEVDAAESKAGGTNAGDAPESSASKGLSHEEVAAAESKAGGSNAGDAPESEASKGLSHEEVAAAEAKAGGDNAGDAPESEASKGLTSAQIAAIDAGVDWGNAGLRKFEPTDTHIDADWGNAGLRGTGMGSTMIPASGSQAGVSMDTGIGISVFFTVTLDVVELGFWTKVSGLGMTISTTDRGESAMTFFQHHLPGHLTYDKITLERPVSANSINIMNWFSAYHMLPIPTAGQISCVDQSGTVLMTWDMLGVTPVAWKGPSFDANQHNVATEQLTIHHMGFM